jgi:hypothetical protein
VYEILAGSAVFPISLSPFDVIRRLRAHHRPIVPDNCGESMDGLIRRCWSDDPSSRPNFDEILEEFRSHGFAIVPGADAAEICRAVNGVIKWERKAKRRRSPLVRGIASNHDVLAYRLIDEILILRVAYG